jgi:hypothetical protein
MSVSPPSGSGMTLWMISSMISNKPAFNNNVKINFSILLRFCYLNLALYSHYVKRLQKLATSLLLKIIKADKYAKSVGKFDCRFEEGEDVRVFQRMSAAN